MCKLALFQDKKYRQFPHKGGRRRLNNGACFAYEPPRLISVFPVGRLSRPHQHVLSLFCSSHLDFVFSVLKAPSPEKVSSTVCANFCDCRSSASLHPHPAPLLVSDSCTLFIIEMGEKAIINNSNQSAGRALSSQHSLPPATSPNHFLMKV